MALVRNDRQQIIPAAVGRFLQELNPGSRFQAGAEGWLLEGVRVVVCRRWLEAACSEPWLSVIFSTLRREAVGRKIWGSRGIFVVTDEEVFLAEIPLFGPQIQWINTLAQHLRASPMEVVWMGIESLYRTLKEE